VVAEIRKRSPGPGARCFSWEYFLVTKKQPDPESIAAINREIQHLDDGTHVRFADIGSQFLDADGNIRVA
jgi:hypothetical protein